MKDCPLPGARRVMAALVSLVSLAACARGEGSGTAATTVALRTHGVDLDEYPPVAVSMIIAQMARSLSNEKTIGMTAGHRELEKMVERYLTTLARAKPVTT